MKQERHNVKIRRISMRDVNYFAARISGRHVAAGVVYKPTDHMILLAYGSALVCFNDLLCRIDWLIKYVFNLNFVLVRK